MGGQLAVLCPEKDAVLCTIADVRLDPCGMQRIYNAFFEEIYPYLDSEDMEPVSLALPALTLPDAAGKQPVAEQTFVFGENPLGMNELRLEQDRLVYRNSRGLCELPYRAGETITAAYPGWPDPATISAGWLADGILRLRCHAIGDFPCGFDMLLVLKGDSVTLQSRRSGDPRTDGYDGAATGTRI